VEVSVRVTVLLCKTKINDIDLMATLANAHEEVVRLNITVNDRLGMNVLNTGNELIGKQKNRFQRELPVAEVEEILQARSKEIKNHGIVPKVGSIPMDRGDADASS
jgi:hypothetical protein